MKLIEVVEARAREERRKKCLEDTLKVTAGLMAGLTIGGAAGLLFAPKSGKETREDIKEVYDEEKAKVKNSYDEKKEKVEEKKDKLVEGAKKQVSKAAEKVETKAGKIKEKTK